MKKILIPALSFLLLVSFAFPAVLFAEGPFDLIVCKGPDCKFEHLIELFTKGINALVKIATIVTVVALIAMGIKLMTSGGNPTALTDVKKRAKWIIVGYVIILAAWLIVYTIMKALVKPEFIFLNTP